MTLLCGLTSAGCQALLDAQVSPPSLVISHWHSCLPTARLSSRQRARSWEGPGATVCLSARGARVTDPGQGRRLSFAHILSLPSSEQLHWRQRNLTPEPPDQQKLGMSFCQGCRVSASRVITLLSARRGGGPDDNRALSPLPVEGACRHCPSGCH